MKFGSILRELREEKDLLQVDLAKKLNITSQSLSQYELSKRMPDIEMINRLADFFNVSVDYLLGRTDIENSSILHVKKDETEYSVHNEISDEIGKLSPESQEDLEAYIKLLKLRDMQKRNTEASDELATLD